MYTGTSLSLILCMYFEVIFLVFSPCKRYSSVGLTCVSLEEICKSSRCVYGVQIAHSLFFV